MMFIANLINYEEHVPNWGDSIFASWRDFGNFNKKVLYSLTKIMWTIIFLDFRSQIGQTNEFS